MKIKRSLKLKNKLIKLQLLQTKAFYKKSYLKLEDIESRLKNVLNIIHKYNVAKKSILFAGVPTKISMQIKKAISTNNHIFVPASSWVIKGILTNRHFVNLQQNSLSNKAKLSKLISKVRTKVELIVVLDKNLFCHLLTESQFSRKPVVLFNTSSELHRSKADYKVPGNLGFKNRQHYESLLYSILVAVLKKQRKINNDY